MTALNITKIIDEMIDLRTGQQFSHGVVVSNGRREEFIPLSRESLQPLVALYAETIGEPPGSEISQEELGELRSAPQAGMHERGAVYTPPEHQPAQGPVPSAPDHLAQSASQRPQMIDPKTGVTFTPIETPSEEEDAPPGEEYEDELTGVASF